MRQRGGAVTAADWLLLVLSAPIVAVGVVKIVLVPLSILFELREDTRHAFATPIPRVSVVIPAYNEEVVLAACVESILRCGWGDLELVLVNDGSTDRTREVMARYADHPAVVLVDKPNGGKGSALNEGITVATGEVLVFADADGLFTHTTIPQLVRGFRHERVGAVCGNDMPVNLDTVVCRLLALMTHVGTGLTRRALALIGCLPIVAGNSGAFRADVVRAVGGFREDTVGEDLELTWRIQLAGYDVEFAPHAAVLAEVPSTWGALWKQRVRWGRGLLQTARIHRRHLLRLHRSPFGVYLPINVAAMVVVPVLQLTVLVVLPVALVLGASPVATTLWGLILWTGLLGGIAMALLGICLDRSWHHLRYLVLAPLWLPFSIFASVVMLRALHLETTGAHQAWNKLDRTGVVSVPAARLEPQRERLAIGAGPAGGPAEGES